MALMRLFFAAPLSVPATLSLDALCAQLPRAQSWHWLEQRDWHITLAFLGDTDGVHLPALCELGESVAAQSSPSGLQLNSLQWWPSNDRPRLLAAVGEATAPLRTLRKLLTAGLRDIGVHYDDKPLRPHVTLMRLQRGAPVHDLTVPPCAIDMKVDSLALYRSERAQGATRYRPLWQRAM